MRGNKLTEGEGERRNAVESDSSCRGPVAASLYERSDWSTWTLNGHWYVGVADVQYARTDQSSMVNGVASKADDGVTTHGAVALVVHENRRQVCLCMRTLSTIILNKVSL